MMPIILSLETSTDVCSVALHDNKALLGEAVIREPQAHASRLAPLIESVMRDAKISFSDLQAVAIASGPGSYTGLRIGTSTAKGLCLALNIPLIAIGTLEVLAYQGSRINHSGAFLCPMIDARRMEVYCLVANANLEIMRPVSATVVDPTTFTELLEQSPVLFFGNGSEKCRAVITHSNAFFMENIYPLASSLGELAMKKFEAGQTEDLVTFKPFYLKEFVAKRAQPHS
jgi:tRNA threonylcarbamoyladenosine biosynthesis protein TsaB